MPEPMGVRVEATPNPNSLKFTLDRPVFSKSESYHSPEQAKASPLAARLFEIKGVRSLFFLNNFISVGRDPSTDWEEIVPKVIEKVQEHFKEVR
ncbi:MAG: NifU N-terminal domain-containing protein [candidate division NC10 bacterium]|nr:NifU N-terminal domain-containing protein [candidate division NC10 bacterium]